MPYAQQHMKSLDATVCTCCSLPVVLIYGIMENKLCLYAHLSLRFQTLSTSAIA